MKTRIMMLGLGNFGISWASSILPACADFAELVAVVDRKKERLEGVPEGVQRFQDIEEALQMIHPDLAINATPPYAHTNTNRILLEHHVPVLCEKPIADTREDALAAANVLAKTRGFLMIGENYRFSPVMRAAHAFLRQGDIGKVRHVRCHFCHHHADYSMYYHGSLSHPLLEDVTIHHLDLARYLSGQEPLQVWCHEFPAAYSWYGKKPASACIVTEMTDDVVFEYTGSLASPESSTPWNGNWEIVCDTGILLIRENQLSVLCGGTAQALPIPDEDVASRVSMLREACLALAEERKGETDFSDNLHSFLWMRDAIDASVTQQKVSCRKEGQNP